MKHTIFTILLAALSAIPAFAEKMSFNGATYDVTRTETQLASGVKYTKLHVTTIRSSSYTGGSMIHVIEADLTDPTVSVKHGDSGRDSRRSLATQAANISTSTSTVVAGANANFWVTTEQPWATKVKYEPHGVSIKDGHMYTDPNCLTTAHVGGPTTTGMLAIDETGRCFIDYLKPQVNGGANSPGSGWNFTLTNHNPAHAHTFGIDQVNRVVCPGTAAMYSSIYGASKTFRTVVSMQDYSTYTGTDCIEILMDFAAGTTEWNIGGETKLVIKEIRKNTKGNGTLGSHDCAIVCRDSYASVANGWTVGDEMTITARVNFASQGSPARILQATSGNCICMANGVIGFNSTQDGYNNNNYARTLYGTNDAGTKLWIAVCEHYPNQQTKYLGFTTKAMAEVLKLFGATWATQVDCGGSSQMYAGGKQVSTSTDSGGLRNVQSGVFILSSAPVKEEEEDKPEPGEEITTLALNLNYEDVAIAELANKTIKRVVPSNDGSHLYILAHDESNNPTLLVYNHETKTVKETLKTTNCVDRRGKYVAYNGTTNPNGAYTGDIQVLGNIDVTEDGILVGIGLSVVPFITNNQGVYLYKWANGSDGIATGDAIHWNVSDLAGNFNNGLAGEGFAYKGTTTNGYAFYSTRTYGGNRLRWQRLTINSTGQIGAGLRANQNTDYGENTKIPTLFMESDPTSSESFILNGTTIDFAKLTMAATNGTAVTPDPTKPTAINCAGIPTSACHTPIFNYDNHFYMVGATSTGIALADVTNGVGSAVNVTASAATLAMNTTTNVAAAGTAFNAGKDVALFVLRDGKISRYSTVANPSTPTETETIETNPVEVRKVIENGQLIIIRDGVRYNALGIKLQ